VGRSSFFFSLGQLRQHTCHRLANRWPTHQSTATTLEQVADKEVELNCFKHLQHLETLARENRLATSTRMLKDEVGGGWVAVVVVVVWWRCWMGGGVVSVAGGGVLILRHQRRRRCRRVTDRSTVHAWQEAKEAELQARYAALTAQYEDLAEAANKAAAAASTAAQRT
jgi:hypothetical protein